MISELELSPNLKAIHPFPARMAPGVALRHLRDKRSLRVLDPMVGSGTVVRIAHALGHKAIGFDTDPLALVIAETWCRPVSPAVLGEAAIAVLNKASDWNSIPASKAYPSNANEETRRFVRYWFDLRARRQLCALVREVLKIRNRALRLHLLTAISKTIIVKDKGVSRARDVAHSRPHRMYLNGPVSPRVAFARATAALSSLLGTQRHSRKWPQIHKGDARKLPLRDSSIDVVMTSPPYLNAIDYLRGHKLSLVWFGFPVDKLRRLRSNNIGAESARKADGQPPRGLLDAVRSSRGLSSRNRRILHRYVTDIESLVAEIWRVLRPNGKCILVVGDSNVGGTFVRNSRLVRATAKRLGFRLRGEYRRKIPNIRRYLPPPGAPEAGNQLSRRMRSEVVLLLSKSPAVKRGRQIA